jgi:hypothetical protein
LKERDDGRRHRADDHINLDQRLISLRTSYISSALSAFDSCLVPRANRQNSTASVRVQVPETSKPKINDSM